MGISRDRAYVWWRRYRAEGTAGLPASTVHRMLVRHGLDRLDHLDRVAPGEVLRTYLKAEGPTSRGVLKPPSSDPNEEPSDGISEKSYLDGGKNGMAHRHN